ncbi:serine/threonine-protein kinase-like protein ccr4 [Quercus suber]|uniref:Serine/threonine-protein kinase-like protein ccr4 n=1 Tax=Quercus suber TaxID=58331 RepID=A0AAW0LA26_QUESU
MRKHQVDSEFVANNSDRGSTVMEERSESLVEYSFFPSAMSESSGSFSCIWNGTNPNSPIYIPSIFPANHSDSESNSITAKSQTNRSEPRRTIITTSFRDLTEFRLQMLLEATHNFSEDHKIGTDLSRLNHKNLVRLLGFCEDRNVRVVVYEYMENGTLHDHLHKLQSTPLISWAARIKVALDAAKGIEYLHAYVVPPIVHCDIKSSNILLDATWTAKVSDLGPSFMSYLSILGAGSVDPEYYKLQLLTPKSDVYSFGVVLLEILSGYKVLHRDEHGEPRSIVDFVVPYIAQDEIHKILDPKVPPPTPFELAAVAYVGNLALHCGLDSLEPQPPPGSNS